jgi:hypothetical protein
VQHGARIKGLARKDDLCAVCDDGEHTENETEAVEKGRRAAEYVDGCEGHAVSNEAGIIDEVAVLPVSIRMTMAGHMDDLLVSQHCCFGIAC